MAVGALPDLAVPAHPSSSAVRRRVELATRGVAVGLFSFPFSAFFLLFFSFFFLQNACASDSGIGSAESVCEPFGRAHVYVPDASSRKGGPVSCK